MATRFPALLPLLAPLALAVACAPKADTSPPCDTEPLDTDTGVPADDSPSDQPPTDFAVAIAPEAPTDVDDLTCTIVTPSTDPEGADIAYTYTWTVDGADAGEATETVAADRTEPGQVWTCTATASDGALTSAATSAAVTILEGPCVEGDVKTLEGADYVHFCATTFTMGCTAGAGTCGAYGETVHDVTLTHDIWVGQYEVKQTDFEATMGYNASTATGTDYPVENLTWSEAAAYANALSDAAGLTECYTCTGTGTDVTCDVAMSPYDCDGYRLPTEAEWEGAARCGEDLVYSGSDSIAEVGWTAANGATSEQAVGLLAANACGIHDMSGNVWEFAQDWKGDLATDAVTDPTGDATGTQRALRGGGWSHYPSYARVANRASLSPTERDGWAGLRLVRP